MPPSYSLSSLDPSSFEHLVNVLSLRVLGAGHTGFGPGPDGGRDGYFEGEAPYPSASEHWKGTWYIQSKFHKPHLSVDAQQWLIAQLKDELTAFVKPETKRKWPDNWILATNIDPSGVPMTGTFDAARRLVTDANPSLGPRFHIWGGRKVLDLLALHPEVADYFRHFLTPGHIFTALFDEMHDSRAQVETVIRHLIVRQFMEQQHTKLEQAGSEADTRPGIHRLFTDVPFSAPSHDAGGLLLNTLGHTAGRCHRHDPARQDTPAWRHWHRHPKRARVLVLRGGPGQGKSTAGQYFCQLQRAALILQDDCFPVLPQTKTLAAEVRQVASASGFWPTVPRLPISIELRDYAQWFGNQEPHSPRGILTYLASRLSASVEQNVLVGTLRRALQTRSWFVCLDGLDEVPNDVKDNLAAEVVHFLDDIALELNSDLLALCTSRPQGYSGQFSALDGPTLDLSPLSPDQALRCARPVLELGRSPDEAAQYFQTLRSAMESASVRELMTSPLQAHIMAVVVRDGGKPPERRWQLYGNFYQVIKRREANRDLPDRRLAKLLREDTQLLKSVHNRLGFVLHARAETSKGAQTRLERTEFKALLNGAVSEMMDNDIEETVGVLMEATANRLVLVNTPDDGDHLRFDIRPLQEFFAAEFLYEAIDADALRRRLEVIAGDAHWREVMHFLLSALVEQGRLTDLTVSIAALNKLNDGNGEDERLLNRRIGRGALLAERLLSEGVLEQDKRVRQQFRATIEPVSATVDGGYLNALTEVKSPSSQGWLLGLLTDSLREADRTESIGAASGLVLILPDGDSRISDVKGFLHSSPAGYVSTALRVCLPEPPTFDRPQHDIKQWVVEFAIECLISASWDRFGGDGIALLCRLLRAAGDRSRSAGVAIGLSAMEQSLLEALLLNPEPLTLDESADDYGVIATAHYPVDWTNAVQCGSALAMNADDEHTSARGLLHLVRAILVCARDQTWDSFQGIVKSIPNGNEELLSGVSDQLRALIPGEDGFHRMRHTLNQLREIDEHTFRALLEDKCLHEKAVPRPKVLVRLGSRCNKSQWEKLVRDIPWLAMNFWSERHWRSDHRIRIPRDESAAETLVERLLAKPEILRDYPGVWGELLEAAPRRDAELREAFRRASSLGEPSAWSSTFKSFPLHLPGESPLLPHVVSAIVTSFGDTLREPLETIRAVRTTALEVAPDAKALQAVSEEENTPAVIAAAIVLTILQSSTDDALEQFGVRLVDTYEPSIGKWYFAAARFCLTLLGGERDEATRTVAAHLLDVTRADYAGRRELNTLLQKWRETSYAPVSSANILQEWLRGGGH